MSKANDAKEQRKKGLASVFAGVSLEPAGKGDNVGNTVLPASTVSTGGTGKTIRPSVKVSRTYRLRGDLLESMENYGWWERMNNTEIIERALEEFFADKKVEPIPKDKRK